MYQSFHKQANIVIKAINCPTSSKTEANMVNLCTLLPYHKNALLIFTITCVTVSLKWKISHKVIFKASISATNHNKSSIMSESQCGDFYWNLWCSGQPYMRSVVYIVKWWRTPTYWIYLLLVFTLIMTLQSTVYRTIILLTFLHIFHKRFYLRWPANSKLQWDAYFMQMKYVAAITIAIIKVLHWRVAFLSLCKGELVVSYAHHYVYVIWRRKSQTVWI